MISARRTQLAIWNLCGPRTYKFSLKKRHTDSVLFILRRSLFVQLRKCTKWNFGEIDRYDFCFKSSGELKYSLNAKILFCLHAPKRGVFDRWSMCAPQRWKTMQWRKPHRRNHAQRKNRTKGKFNDFSRTVGIICIPQKKCGKVWAAPIYIATIARLTIYTNFDAAHFLIRIDFIIIELYMFAFKINGWPRLAVKHN